MRYAVCLSNHPQSGEHQIQSREVLESHTNALLAQDTWPTIMSNDDNDDARI